MMPLRRLEAFATFLILCLRDHHMLGDLIVANRLGREVLAETGLLESAMRGFRCEWQMVVHPYSTELELRRETHGAADISREDRRCKAVEHVIALAQRIGLICKFLNRKYRPKYLVL